MTIILHFLILKSFLIQIKRQVKLKILQQEQSIMIVELKLE